MALLSQIVPLGVSRIGTFWFGFNFLNSSVLTVTPLSTFPLKFTLTPPYSAVTNALRVAGEFGKDVSFCLGVFGLIFVFMCFILHISRFFVRF